jgi:hypothetical protein
MRKFFVLWILLIASVCSVLLSTPEAGFASGVSENRWQVLSSQDGVTTFFDTATIRFANSPGSQIRFWQKCAFDSSAAARFAALFNLPDETLQISYFLEDRIVDVENHEKSIYELDAYDINNMLIETNRPVSKTWETIQPDSESDKIYLAIVAYANTHKQQLIENGKQYSVGKDDLK